MRVRRGSLILSLLVIILAVPTPVEGHALYESSTPPSNGILASSPDRVVLTFSEPVAVEPPGSPSVRVTNASGDRVESGSAVVSTQDPRTVSVGLQSIGPCVYTVAWTVKSAVDGHTSRGSFSFAVQNPDGSLCGSFSNVTLEPPQPISPVEVTGRFLTFLGMTIAFGAALFTVVAWLPGVRDAGREPSPENRVGRRILAHWGRIGALTFVLGVALWWSTVGVSLSPSPFNASLAGSLVSALVLLGAFTLVARAEEGEAEGKPPWPSWAALVAGGFAIASASVGTHSTADAGVPGAALQAIHLACAGAWVSGLLALLRLRPLLREAVNVALARHVYGRFSRMAFYAVGGVLGAGAGMGLLLVESIDNLIRSGYGWVLLAKIGLFVPMVVLGGMNRYRFLPAAAGTGDVPEKAIADLSDNVRREVALGATVLAVAALLTALVPPGTAVAAGELDLETTKDGVRFQFLVDPYPRTPGVYTYSILVTDPSGGPYAGARNVTLTFTLLGSTLAPQSVPLDGPHGNHFFTGSPAMSQAGTWRIDVLFQRWSGLDVRVTFHIVVDGG